jgi:hypothetical protein
MNQFDVPEHVSALNGQVSDRQPVHIMDCILYYRSREPVDIPM